MIFPRFEYRMFYVLCSLVTYLLTLRRIYLYSMLEATPRDWLLSVNKEKRGDPSLLSFC
jgi:hypothetical protein